MIRHPSNAVVTLTTRKLKLWLIDLALVRTGSVEVVGSIPIGSTSKSLGKQTLSEAFLLCPKVADVARGCRFISRFGTFLAGSMNSD